MGDRKISIIIPAKGYNELLEECVSRCLELDYPDFEILVLPDYSVEEVNSPNVKIVPTGPVSPAEKRDRALSVAEGEILAFLDDDAWPERDWLSKAVQYFENEDIAAVGGPAITPPDDTFMQKAGGFVYTSPLGGGNLRYRYTPQRLREIEDYPTCNLLVRKDAMEEVGGFDTKFWPGEDTKLCLAIINDLGKKILYAPDVVVYHHRRPLFGPHLKQVKSYGLHRGYFAKKFPKTSLRLSYFLPTLLVAGLILGLIVSSLIPQLALVYIVGLLVYVGAVFSTTLRGTSLAMASVVTAGVVLTHITYGIWFVIGLLSRRLKEEDEDNDQLPAA